MRLFSSFQDQIEFTSKRGRNAAQMLPLELKQKQFIHDGSFMSDGTIQFSFHPLCTQISGWNHQITGVSEGHLTVDPFKGFWNQTRPALHIPVLSHSVVKKWSSPFDVDTPHRTADAFECSESRFVWNSLTEQHRTLHQGSEDTFSSSSCYCQVWDVSFCIHQAHNEEDK